MQESGENDCMWCYSGNGCVVGTDLEKVQTVCDLKCFGGLKCVILVYTDS